ncbi:unnamed protein product, partial [Rotaria sordida]
MILLLILHQNSVIFRRSQLSTIDLYAYARLLPVNGLIDPPCNQSRNIY